MSGDVYLGPTNWDLIFGEEFTHRDRCWETCGSFCCKPVRVQKHLSFLRRTGVEMIFLPGEYHYLTQRGRMQRGFTDGMNRAVVKLPSGASFPVYRTVCQLDGICSDHHHRPIICRVYPWMPVPTLDGEIEALEPAAVIDLYWDHLKNAHRPCTIGELTPREQESYRVLCAELFRDPVNVFYLRAASIYRRALVRGVVERHPQLLELDEAGFFLAWERLMVMGKLYKPADVLQELQVLWDQSAARWGEAFTGVHL